MTLLLVILTIGLMLSIDVRKIKSPFDDEGKQFSFKNDWWKKQWDNALPMFFAGLIGGVFLGGEIGGQAVHWVATNYLGLDEKSFLENVAIESLEYTAVFLVTIIFIKFFSKKKS